MRTEPKNVEVEYTHDRDTIHGYTITVNEWSDDTFTVIAEKPETEGFAVGWDRIIDEPWSYDTFPTEEDIQTHIEELLEERFENPGSITNMIIKGA